MNRMAAGVLAAVAALAVGCDAGSDSSLAAAASSADSTARSLPRETLSLENGHPLSLPSDDPGVATFESELLRLVNAHRVSLGLNALIDVGSLGDAARAHGRHMIDHRFFDHVSPEGLTPGDRLELADLDWTSVGENIAAGFSSPQEVFDAWLASPSHRDNIESDRYTHAGAGYAFDAAPTPEFPEGHYWAMLFLRW